MANFILSERAEAELLDALAYTEDHFGARQAEVYHAGFEKTFGLLAAFPGIGRRCDELAPRYRRHPHQAHYIFFTEEDGYILIRSIIHTAKDLRPELFD